MVFYHRPETDWWITTKTIVDSISNVLLIAVELMELLPYTGLYLPLDIYLGPSAIKNHHFLYLRWEFCVWWSQNMEQRMSNVDETTFSTRAKSCQEMSVTDYANESPSYDTPWAAPPQTSSWSGRWQQETDQTVWAVAGSSPGCGPPACTSEHETKPVSELRRTRILLRAEQYRENLNLILILN